MLATPSSGRLQPADASALIRSAGPSRRPAGPCAGAEGGSRPNSSALAASVTTTRTGATSNAAAISGARNIGLTGSGTAPTRCAAQNASARSTPLGRKIPTRSPGSTPVALSREAWASTRRANSPYVSDSSRVTKNGRSR